MCAAIITDEGAGQLGGGVSDYQIGAFEALEWAWLVLRDFRGQPKGIDKARSLIQDILKEMGKGSSFNFSREISKTMAVQ